MMKEQKRERCEKISLFVLYKYIFIVLRQQKFMHFLKNKIFPCIFFLQILNLNSMYVTELFSSLKKHEAFLLLNSVFFKKWLSIRTAGMQ